MNVTLATPGKGHAVNAAFTALAQLTVWITADGIRRRRAYSASLRERSLRRLSLPQLGVAVPGP